MIAVCKICGELVTGLRMPVLSVQFSVDIPTQQALQEFDTLGQAFVQHIGLRHPKHAQELVAVSNLSMKVFAMRQAQSSEEIFDGLRQAWRDTIRQAVFDEPVQAADAARPSTGGASSSPSSPSPVGS